MNAGFDLGTGKKPKADSKPYVNSEVALKWYKSAAENGHMHAQYRAGLIIWDAKEYGSILRRQDPYLDEKEKEQRKKRADNSTLWYGKAAKDGFAPAQVAMGIYCEEYTDSLSAKRWFEKAAVQEDPDGMFCLAWLFYNGKVLGHGIEKDLKQADEWFKKAALAGQLDARVPFIWKALKGDNEAYRFLMSLPGFDDFEYEVGLLYYGHDYRYRKLELKENIGKAIKYLKISAEQRNNPDAQYWVGYIHEHEKANTLYNLTGIPQLNSKNEARKYYEMAAMQGHDAAMRALKRF